MGLLRLATLGAIGYAGYKYFEKQRHDGSAAFASGQTGNVRDSGPNAMRDKPTRDWGKTDEESDQSFPASDPPANY